MTSYRTADALHRGKLACIIDDDRQQMNICRSVAAVHYVKLDPKLWSFRTAVNVDLFRFSRLLRRCHCTEDLTNGNRVDTTVAAITSSINFGFGINMTRPINNACAMAVGAGSQADKCKYR